MLSRSVLVLALLTPSFAADTPPGLTVHEWGTFTSVAAEDGSAVRWVSLTPPADLPCFVYHLSAVCIKCGPNRVRMETPVLYFYSPTRLTASVHVDLPSGLITEWYPRATIKSALQPGYTYGGDGNIEWNHVEVLPDTSPALPDSAGGSHYYAARKTDSAPLQVGDEAEKLLFYRGIADFDVPVQARFLPDGKLELRNTAHDPIEFAILFESRQGQVGYRLIQNLRGKQLLDTPDLTATVESVHQELAQALVSAGLYPKEAAAMIETWRDSWFEDGMRIFYIVPRQTVDAVLPIKISPQPEILDRVFVGRAELLSPAMRQAIETALASGDTDTLARCKRFLRPWMEQLALQPGQIRISLATANFLAEAEQPPSAAPASCSAAPSSLPTEQR